jgi:hypothetical protein
MVRNPRGYYMAELWQTRSSKGKDLVKARAYLMQLKRSGDLDRHITPLKQCGDVRYKRENRIEEQCALCVLPTVRGVRCVMCRALCVVCVQCVFAASH